VAAWRWPDERGRASGSLGNLNDVIYCVVPEELEPELYQKLVSYYDEDPNVTVIVDRRKQSRRAQGSTGGGQREVRDRRRRNVPGEFPAIEAADS